MKTKKIFIIGIGLLLTLSLLSGCGSQNGNSSRIVEVDEDESGFPGIFVDDGDSFIFDYRITGAKFVESVTDTQFEKLITPGSGRFLVVKFSAINRSRDEEYGNKPDFAVKYKDEQFGPNPTAGNAEELNEGVRAYSSEKIKSARKGKYVKVFEITNYDESVQNFTLMIDGPGRADGEISVDLEEMNKNKI